MAVIPAFLLRDTVTLEPREGVGVYGAPVALRAHVQEARKLVRSSSGGITAEATLRTFLRPGVAVPLGSRITVRGQLTTAVEVGVRDGRGLPTPDHLDVWCERVDFLPTTTVTVLRGSAGRNEYGDPVDSLDVVASGLEAAFCEEGQRRYEPTEHRGGVVEEYYVRLRSTARLLEADRLVDAAGVRFVVTKVLYPPPAVGPELGLNDVRVTARRVAATSRGPD